MIKIKKTLKVAQNKQKSYVDKGRTHREFKVGDHVFLKVKANISYMKLANCSMLATRYCGLFEILERIEHATYMISFPTSMSTHNSFHLSLPKKYIPYANHVIDWNVISVEQ